MSERTKNLPRRSCHATPGSNEKMLGKAPGLGADMVFLDLEDSVAPLEKEAAREKVVARDQRPGLGRHRPVRARERVGHRVDVPRRRPRRRARGRAARRDHAAEGAVGGRGGGARPAAHPDREGDRVARRRSASRRRSRRRGASSTSRRSAPRPTGSRRSSSARPTSPRPPRCRCSPVACRSPSTPATTSTTCSRRSSWPAAPTGCR